MGKNKRPPAAFRPLLWSLDWDKIDVKEDKEDIIMGVINEGTLDQWHWIIKEYGRKAISDILARRLTTEFHPESRNLAKVVFNVHSFRNARGGVNTRSRGVFPASR